MIFEHIHFTEDVNIHTGKAIICGVYHLSDKKECDIAEAEENKDAIKLELVRSFKKQMIEDLSGYFNDSLTDEDIEYLANMSHTKLQKIQQLDEFTKHMSIEQVQKILSAYAILVDLGFASKENND